MHATGGKPPCVLAVDPTTRGFGFAVLEGPERLIDWGVKQARVKKNVTCLRLVGELTLRYRIDWIVVEDVAARGSRRCFRVRELIARIECLAARKRVRVHRISRTHVRRAFAESGWPSDTKQAIAIAVARRFPELAPRLPPLRRPWMAEDERMSIFDAAALASAAFHITQRRSCMRTGQSLAPSHVQKEDSQNPGN